MATPFKKIGIFGRVKNPSVTETLKGLIHFLLEQNLTVYVENESAVPLEGLGVKTVAREKIGQFCDLLIVVGGDGSMLHASHAIVDQQVPVLGINRGSVGFLTDVRPQELQKILDVLAGKYIIEERFLLSTRVELHGKTIGEDCALNEAAIIPDAVPHMIEFEIYIDNQFVCSQDSDGLIIATPTGSTAYALSGGGPILHPQLDAIVLVPMFPHTLSSRPIVIDANQQITIIISPNNKTAPRVSCDGREYLSTPTTSHIIINKKAEKLLLVHPQDYNYYEALRSKLHWGRKLHYSE